MLIQLTSLNGEKIDVDLNKVNSILIIENGRSQISYEKEGETSLCKYLVAESVEEIFLIAKKENLPDNKMVS